MITTAKIKGFFVKNGYRILKVMQYGVTTADECVPFGDDSNPLNNMVAIYAETDIGGDAVIIGYIHKKKIAKPGEKRIFSLNKDGSDLKHVYLREDGIIEVGGDIDNLVKYSKLNMQLQKQITDINAELVKIQTGLTGVGGVYTPQLVQLDLTTSKCEDLRCN